MREQIPPENSSLYLQEIEGLLYAAHDGEHIEAVDYYYHAGQTLFELIREMARDTDIDKAETENDVAYWLDETTEAFLGVIRTYETSTETEEIDTTRYIATLLVEATDGVNAVLEEVNAGVTVPEYSQEQYMRIVEKLKSLNPDENEYIYLAMYIKNIYRGACHDI